MCKNVDLRPRRVRGYYRQQRRECDSLSQADKFLSYFKSCTYVWCLLIILIAFFSLLEFVEFFVFISGVILGFNFEVYFFVFCSEECKV